MSNNLYMIFKKTKLKRVHIKQFVKIGRKLEEINEQ